MNFKQHKIGALVGSGVVASVWYFGVGIPLELAGTSIPFVFLGGNFPDTDTESIPSKWLARFVFITTLAMIVIGVWIRLSELILLAAIEGSLFAFLKTLKHRGFTHKYWIPAVLIGLAFLPHRTDYIPIVLTGFAIGIFIHLFIDKIWPWQFRRCWDVRVKLFGG